LAFDNSLPPLRFLDQLDLKSSMGEQSASAPIPTAASLPPSPSSSEPLNTSPPRPSDSEATQGASISQEQPTASIGLTQAGEGGKDDRDDVEGGSNSVSTTQDKGKGRAIGEATTDMGNGPEDLARALAGFKMPEKGTLPLLLVSAMISNRIS